MKHIARLLVIAGISFFALGLYHVWLRTDDHSLAATKYQYTASDEQLVQKNNLPTHMTIPDLNIALAVIPAKFEGSEWQTTKDGASYLTSSPVPGSVGNSVFYAHNWNSLFGKLPQIKAGNIIEIEFADHTKKKFAVAYTLEVSPGDASIIGGSDDKRITLYTCSGFLDTKRFAAVAFLVE